jgi:hypothetical protein
MLIDVSLYMIFYEMIYWKLVSDDQIDYLLCICSVERMRAYKAGQIPHSETQEMHFQNTKKSNCEKWVISDINYTILDSYILIKYGSINDMC